MEPDIDTSVAHSARVHDYWLGGCFLVTPGVDDEIVTTARWELTAWQATSAYAMRSCPLRRRDQDGQVITGQRFPGGLVSGSFRAGSAPCASRLPLRCRGVRKRA